MEEFLNSFTAFLIARRVSAAHRQGYRQTCSRERRRLKTHHSFPSCSHFSPQAAFPILHQHALFCPFGPGLVQWQSTHMWWLLFLSSEVIWLGDELLSTAGLPRDVPFHAYSRQQRTHFPYLLNSCQWGRLHQGQQTTNQHCCLKEKVDLVFVKKQHEDRCLVVGSCLFARISTINTSVCCDFTWENVCSSEKDQPILNLHCGNPAQPYPCHIPVCPWGPGWSYQYTSHRLTKKLSNN